MARAAGTSVQLMGKDNGYAVLRMPSSELRRVLLTCRATIGEVGNAEHSNIVVGKAGRSRWAGVRPTVRGTVMNPVTTHTAVVKVRTTLLVVLPSPHGVSQPRVIRPATRRRLLTA